MDVETGKHGETSFYRVRAKPHETDRKSSSSDKQLLCIY